MPSTRSGRALKELGWVEGGNLVIEQRYAHGDAERYGELAAELVRLKVDVLVTDGSPATKGAQQATATTPIVFVSGDPIARDQGFVEVGGLMSYGASHRDVFRRVAAYADRILKGAKPADLPEEQPTKLDLAVHLKTAKTLGLTIPQALLLRVDQVVQ